MAVHMISVSVVGSGKPIMDTSFADLARGVGSIVAQHGCNLVTGGGLGVMEMVAEGFCKTPHRVGRSIGILPGTMSMEGEPVLGQLAPVSITPKDHYPNAFVEVPVYTHLPGNDPKALTSRNYLNARTGAVMIALQGDKGTQAEIELAVSMKRPVIALLRGGERIGTYARPDLPQGVLSVEGLDELSDVLKTVLCTAETVVRLTRPSFDAIKAVYSIDPASVHSCSMQFPDTCAIRMSEALDKTVAGIKKTFDASGRNQCPHGFMRGAEDLAAVLRRADVFGVYDAGFSKPGEPPSAIQGKNGIVAYINIPNFSGQGHIDLWDGASPVGSAYWDADPIWFWRLN